MVAENIKSSESLNVFKSRIKYWTPNPCPCRICKTYFCPLGYINSIFVFVESTICLTYLFFYNVQTLKILLKIIVKIFNPFNLRFICLLHHIMIVPQYFVLELLSNWNKVWKRRMLKNVNLLTEEHTEEC